MIKEREAQIVYKQSIKEGWERQERKWLQSQQEEMEKLDKLEKIQAEKRKESVKALALDRLMQVGLVCLVTYKQLNITSACVIMANILLLNIYLVERA